VLPWIWALLAQFVGPGLSYIITWPVAFWVHRVPPPGPPSLLPFLQHPPLPMLGTIWVALFLASHAYYAIRHLSRRYDPTHRGIPQPGHPGEDKCEIVQRRWRDSAASLERFYHVLILQRPATWNYTTQPFAPIVELRGRLLLIREDMLHQSQVRDLSPELAGILGEYNSLDWFFNDILDYYPHTFHFWQFVLGIGIWIPTLIKVTAWPLWHWRRRIMAYDRLAWMCGQGQQLYDRLAVLPASPRSFFAPQPLLQTRLGQLEALIRTEHHWMQEHHLVDESVEPLLLHHQAPSIPKPQREPPKQIPRPQW